MGQAQNFEIHRLKEDVASLRTLLAEALRRADEVLQFANAAAESRDNFAAQAAELRRALEPFAEAERQYNEDGRGFSISPHNRVGYEAFTNARAALALTPGEALERERTKQAARNGAACALREAIKAVEAKLEEWGAEKPHKDFWLLAKAQITLLRKRIERGEVEVGK